MASRRALRTDTRADSASCLAWRIKPLRVSSVSMGMGMRMTSPAVAGLRPRSDFMMAFSISGIMDLSQAVRLRVRASSTLILATRFSGVSAP